MRRLRDWSYPRLLLTMLGIVLAIGLIVGASTSGAAFGTYTYSWEGASELRSEATAAGAETVIATNTTRYTEIEANGTVAIAIAAEEPYGPQDRERIAEFVRRGGTLVVADDIGQSNQLLQELGASTRIDGTPVRDPREYYRSPALPVATQTDNQSYVANSESFTLNYGTVLMPNGAEVLVRTSEYAYLDTNRNQQFDANETLGARPAMTTETIGRGQLLVISDSSALINVMLDRPGNQAFVQQLFESHERVLIDQSRASDLPALAVALVNLRGSAILQLLVVAGLVGAVALVEGRPGWGRGLFDRFGGRSSPMATGPATDLQPSELRAILATEYPEWDFDRQERVIKVIMNQRKKGDKDD